MRLWKGKAFVKTDSHVLHAVTKYSCSTRKQLHTFSQTALRMKRQINWLSIFLNYFAVMHSFLRSTLCRMEYESQRKENMG